MWHCENLGVKAYVEPFIFWFHTFNSRPSASCSELVCKMFLIDIANFNNDWTQPFLIYLCRKLHFFNAFTYVHLNLYHSIQFNSG